MSFYDNEHKKEIEKLDEIWNKLTELTNLAKDHGIKDIFQDNGAKVLQQLIISNMVFLKGREGNDAKDKNGIEWEFKSINIETTATGFSTDHHSTNELLDRFNSVPWLFSIYSGTVLQEMYVLSPGQLTEWVNKQKNNLSLKVGQNSLNNPKIPIKYVREHGTKIYPINKNNPLDPSTLDGSN